MGLIATRLPGAGILASRGLTRRAFLLLLALVPSQAMYSDSFRRAVRRVLHAEDASGKGLVTFDQGGETKWGISKRANPDVDVRNLTRDEAVAIYWDRYWLVHNLDALPADVASQWFLFLINMTPDTARRLLQRAVRACGVPIAEDGAVGPVTLNAIERIPAGVLCAALRSEAAGVYRLLAGLNPDRNGASLAGWLKRAYEH